MMDQFDIFVYPFEHGMNSEDRKDFLDNAWQEGWRPWIYRLGNGGEVGTLLNRLRYWFHPPTLEAIYPEIHRLAHCKIYYHQICSDLKKDCKACQNDPGKKAQKELAKQLYDNVHKADTSEECLQRVWSGLNSDDTLRLTRDFTNGNKGGAYQYDVKTQNEKFFFRIGWIDAYLFPFQVGFLCIKVILQTPQQQKEKDIDRLMLFHKFFRDIDTQKKAALLKKWLFPLKANKSLRTENDMDFSLEEYIYRFKLFSFVSLNPDFENEKNADSYYREVEPLDRLLYELASVSDPDTLANNERWQPSSEYLKDELLAKNKIAIWRYWRGMAIKDTVAFISLEGKEQPKAAQYEEVYFPLYIYVLNLKIQLFRFSNRLNLKRLRDNEKRISQVLKDFLMFRNEYWHSEISPNFQMAILFKKFRHGLEVDEDYQRILSEADSMFQYQESLSNRRLNRLICILTLGAIICGFFSMTTDIEALKFTIRLLLIFMGILVSGILVIGFQGIRFLWRKIKNHNLWLK